MMHIINNNKNIIIAAVLCSISGLFAGVGPETVPVLVADPCAICFQEFESQDDIILGNGLFEPCHKNHKFHNECLLSWIAARFSNHHDITCPVCRGLLRRESLLVPLLESVVHNNLVQVRTLLDEVVGIDGQIATVLGFWRAVEFGQTEIVKTFIDHGVQVDAHNSYGTTALMLASFNGHTATVEMLLTHGAQVDARNNHGDTALMLASQNGHTEIVEKLLDKGADVDMSNSGGDTALLLAALRGHTEIVGKLLDKGVAVDMSNSYGDTALMVAAENGHMAIVEMLLNRRAQIDVQNNHSDTALIFASQNGHTEIVGKLLDKGVAVDMRNSDGATALMFAAQNGYIRTYAT